MIEKIIHIADLHIPNDVKARPYTEMAERLVKEVEKEVSKCETPDNCRIAMVGDIFHQKIRATNEARDIFHTLLNAFNGLCGTVVVAGNHDMLESNMDRTDSLSPTFNIEGAYPNVMYLDKALGYKSGYGVDDNVVWVLFSMFDRFARPEMDGLREEYPDHRFVGLFHGDIPGTVTDTGYTSETGVDTSIFAGLDCVLAGHIHKYQVIKKDGIPIVYPGSVFQCNAGENIGGHGFVVWDLTKMKHRIHEVPNKYRIVKFDISSYDDVDNDVEQVINL